jgi:hypothetical protein
MNCQKCGKQLDVEKEGNRLCLHCQVDYVNQEWIKKITRPEKYENTNKTQY